MKAPVTFFGLSIPNEVKQAIPILNGKQTTVEELKVLIERVFIYLTSSKTEQDEFEIPDNLLGEKVLREDMNILLTCIYLIVRTAVRTKAVLSTVHANLLAMEMTEEFSKIICKGILKLRDSIETSVVKNRVSFPSLQSLRWRVDVTVSSGALSRIMRPNILFQLVLSDTTVKTFEVSIEQFNQLRYNVAKALSDIHRIERHPIIRVVKDMDKREKDKMNN